MPMKDRVYISRRFLRSIRIDTDLSDYRALDGFVCPQSSADVLLTMARHVSETRQGAFTWTGPYGSGKSSLGAALLYLVTGDEQARDAAVSFGEYLVATQTEQGGWRDPDYEPDDLLIHIDHAVEFNIWLQEVSACLTARG